MSKLTLEQITLANNFADVANDFPKLNFEQIAKKVLGARGFPKTAAGKAFRRLAKKAFDGERATP